MRDKSMTGRYGHNTREVREAYLLGEARAGRLTEDGLRVARGLPGLGGEAGTRKVTEADVARTRREIGG